MLQVSTVQFLQSLKKNNNKEWFDKNRKKYGEAKQDFALFVQGIIDSQGKNDGSIANLKAKDCLFRINRDIRFSKDKSPYKTNFGAFINKAGKKSMLAGYYFHLEPAASFVGGGMYMPQPEDLKKVRQEIDYNFDEFKKIIGNKKFKSIYKDLDKSAEYSLSRVPKGYEPDNPAADYLKLKSFVAIVPISDVVIVSKSLIKKSTEALATLQPLIEFLNVAVDG